MSGYLEFLQGLRGKLPPLEGKALRLQEIRPADVSGEYVAWLNDPEVVAFTESRFQRHTLESVAAFVDGFQDNSTDWLLAICLKDSGRHIGNIRLGPIDVHHYRAPLGILIGDKGQWGRGYGSESLGLAVKLGFEVMGLHRLTAGVHSLNQGSLKAFQNNGFKIEGEFSGHSLVGGRFIDDYVLGLNNPSFQLPA